MTLYWRAANYLLVRLIFTSIRIPSAEGARKVRWTVADKGKRSGVRVIYFNQTEQGVIVLITLYQKADQSTIQPSDIKKAI